MIVMKIVGEQSITVCPVAEETMEKYLDGYGYITDPSDEEYSSDNVELFSAKNFCRLNEDEARGFRRMFGEGLFVGTVRIVDGSLL